MGNSKILVLKNNNKEKENQPDYRVFVAPKENNSGGNDWEMRALIGLS